MIENRMMTGNRVDCLYRVSTDKQVDYNDKSQADMEAKKMIVSCLIKRVDVYRDYKLHIDFNIDFEQFSMGIDIISIAA